jgi:hypothetical protein
LTHINPLMQPLLEDPNCRRLKRRLPIDLKWNSVAPSVEGSSSWHWRA